MKKLILAPIVMSLSAFTCQQRPQPPSMSYIYCVTPEQYAALLKAEPAKVGGTLTGDARKDVKIEGESNIALRSYADGLLKVIGTCTK